MAEMVRVNTRISKTLNDWLDKESGETGVPKSTIVMLALETYYQQREVVKNMTDLTAIYQKLEQIESRIQKTE